MYMVDPVSRIKTMAAHTRSRFRRWNEVQVSRDDVLADPPDG
jgi:hypothetical protein